MNNDKNPTNRDNSVINDESRGLNESAKYENARNNYENNEPVLNENDTAPTTNFDEVNDDISPLENGPQKNLAQAAHFL